MKSQEQAELKPIEAQAVVVREASGALAAPSDFTAGTVLQTIQAFINGGVTEKNVMALEKLVGLCERMQDRQAQQQFAGSFIALKQELPAIEATKAVPNDDGSIRYKYAPLEEIEDKLRPYALKHGFSWTFGEGPHAEGRITKSCTVIHVGGHKATNFYTCRIGKGPPKTNESQADGSAHSYAKRGALCDAFGIVIAHQDNDARAEGDHITEEQARTLRAQVTGLGVDERAFLKFAQAPSYEQIHVANFPLLVAWLDKKGRMK